MEILFLRLYTFFADLVKRSVVICVGEMCCCRSDCNIIVYCSPDADESLMVSSIAVKYSGQGFNKS